MYSSVHCAIVDNQPPVVEECPHLWTMYSVQYEWRRRLPPLGLHRVVDSTNDDWYCYNAFHVVTQRERRYCSPA